MDEWMSRLAQFARTKFSRCSIGCVSKENRDEKKNKPNNNNPKPNLYWELILAHYDEKTHTNTENNGDEGGKKKNFYFPWLVPAILMFSINKTDYTHTHTNTRINPHTRNTERWIHTHTHTHTTENFHRTEAKKKKKPQPNNKQKSFLLLLLLVLVILLLLRSSSSSDCIHLDIDREKKTENPCSVDIAKRGVLYIIHEKERHPNTGLSLHISHMLHTRYGFFGLLDRVVE